MSCRFAIQILFVAVVSYLAYGCDMGHDDVTLKHNLLSTFPTFSTDPLQVNHDPINLNSYDIYYKVADSLECTELSLPNSFLQIQNVEYDATTNPKLIITGYLANADGTGMRRLFYVELQGRKDLQAHKMVRLNYGITDFNGWKAMRDFLNPRYRNPVFRIIIEAKTDSGSIDKLEVNLSLEFFGSTNGDKCNKVNFPDPDQQWLQ